MNKEEQLEEFKRGIVIRKASALDMPEVACVFGISRREALPFLPQLHTKQEDIDYFSNTVFPENQVYVALSDCTESDINIVDKRNVDKRIIGFIVFEKGFTMPFPRKSAWLRLHAGFIFDSP